MLGIWFISCILQVRTLFVSGLPTDIKPRELYLLFRPFKVKTDVLNGKSHWQSWLLIVMVTQATVRNSLNSHWNNELTGGE